VFATARHIIIGIIDFFHKPFERIIPKQPFRYLACGGSVAMLNIAMEYIAIHFILHKSVTHVLGYSVAPEVGAWFIANAVSLPVGFIMSRHIVYPESNIQSHVQAFRYALTTVIFIGLTYLLVKLFAYSVPKMDPTVAYTFICIFISVISYVTQRLFTFKVVEEEVAAGEEEIAL